MEELVFAFNQYNPDLTVKMYSTPRKKEKKKNSKNVESDNGESLKAVSLCFIIIIIILKIIIIIIFKIFNLLLLLSLLLLLFADPDPNQITHWSSNSIMFCCFLLLAQHWLVAAMSPKPLF